MKKVPEGVEPPCISFAGSRITVLPEYHLEKLQSLIKFFKLEIL